MAMSIVEAVLVAILAAQFGAPPKDVPSGTAPPIPDILFVPTPHDVATRMLTLARVTKDDVIYDLGCGDGRIVVAAARRYGCRAVGCEIVPNLVRRAREAVAAAHVERLVRIDERDMFTVDLRPATVVVLYLSPQYNARLLPQLESLRPGSRIVSHQFEIPGLRPQRVIEVKSADDGRRHTLYLWTTPLPKPR